MYSSAIVLSLLASSVLSSPAGHAHNHKHVRQVEVVDVVDVYTTVTLGQAPPPTSKPVVHHQAAAVPEEKMAEPVHHFNPPQGGPPPAQSQAPPPPPATTQAPPPPPATTQAAPASDPSSAPSSGNEYLDAHNKYRAAHGAVPMVWDSDLASKAVSEVNGCPGNDVQSGSNWMGSSGSTTGSAAIDMWYGEMSTYAQETNNYQTNPPANPPPGTPETGHFSQMIWNASTSLGCGMATSCGGSYASQVICLYMPAGNMVFNGQPQYTENVFPLKG